MNMREGRSGVREMTAAAVLAIVTNGLFAVNNQDAYENGNMQYLASLTAVLLCLVLVGLLERAMTANGHQSLDALLTGSFGRVGGAGAGLVLTVGMLLAAVLPMTRFLLILTRYVFVEDDLVSVTMYLLPTILLLAYLGLEALVRTSFLTVCPVIVAFLAVLLMGIPAYRAYRLYPLLGGNAAEFLMQTLATLFRFLPAVTALAIVSGGAHGIQYSARAARRALIIGGGIVVLMQLCIGMIFTSDYLAQLPAPIYHFTMQVRSDHPAMRLDKLILFVWILCGLLAAAFYVYASALLFCRLFHAKDIRPAVAVMAAVTACAMLLLHYATDALTRTVYLLYRYGYALLLAPLLLTAVVSMIPKRRTPAWQG